MKIFFSIFFIVLLTSCNSDNKNVIELEILNSEFISYSGNEFHYFSEEYLDNYVSKYRYKITNNSKKKYVFNLDIFSEFVNKRYQYYNNNDILFFLTENKDSADVYSRFNFQKKLNYSDEYLNFINKTLGSRYKNIQKITPFKINNFTLNPGETKYFENFVLLPFGDNFNPNNVKFLNNEKYFVKLIIWSDSSRVEEVYNDSELKSFEENGYEFYHGIISSKNKVLVKQSNFINK